ncbi:hypothetical protein ACFPIF_15190 [Brevundimonas faecalis]|uniref:hypothetical protein n=1 Tax=Brevundimonas faecalis TaxID=947378 RepID=UPI00361FA672
MADIAELSVRISSEETLLAAERVKDLSAVVRQASAGIDRMARAARGMGEAMAGSLASIDESVKRLLEMQRIQMDAAAAAAQPGLMDHLQSAAGAGVQAFEMLGDVAKLTGLSMRTILVEAAAAIGVALGPVLVAVAAIAAVSFAAMVVGTHAAGKAIGDLTEGMNLSEEQLKVLEERGISTTTTMGDVFRGVGRTIKEVFFGMFGDEIAWLGRVWSDFLDGVANVVVSGMKSVGGVFLGTLYVIRDTWKMLPAVIGDIIYSSVNLIISGMNVIINSYIDYINFLLSKVNEIADKVPFLDGVRIGKISHFNIDHVNNPYSGAVSSMFSSVADLFRRGGNDFAAAVDRAGLLLIQNIKSEGQGRVSSGVIGARGEIDSYRVDDSNNYVGAYKQSTGDGGAGRRSTEVDVAVRAGSQGERCSCGEQVEVLEQIVAEKVEGLNVRVPDITSEFRLISDELKEVDKHAQAAARNMALAFGKSGKAVGDLLTQLTRYRSRMADIDLQENEDQITKEQASRSRAELQIQSYGDMAAAARGFFKEGSDGYQALLAVEQAYRAFQMAQSLQAMAQGWMETGASVAQSGTKGAASMAAGAAKMFEFLGPFGFPLVAAMVALLAGIGLKGGKSGGGGAGAGAGAGGGGAGAPANDNGGNAEASTAAVRAYDARDVQSRDQAAGAVASKIDVRVSADRDGLNAYVVGAAQREAANVAAPMAAAAAAGAKRDVFQTMNDRQAGNRKVSV